MLDAIGRAVNVTGAAMEAHSTSVSSLRTAVAAWSDVQRESVA